MTQASPGWSSRALNVFLWLVASAALSGCVSQETHEQVLQNAQQAQRESMRREQALAELHQQLVRMNATLLQTLQQHAETQRVLAAEVARLREASATAQSSRQADAQERIRQLEQQNQATESRAHELESEIKKLRGGLFHLRSRNGKVVELDSSSPWR